MGSSVDVPAARSVATEGRDTLQAQIELAPDQYAAQAKYQPLYAALNNETLQQQLFGPNGDGSGILGMMQKAAPQIAASSSAANTAQRTADVGDVANLAPAAAAAFKAANPQEASLMDSLNQRAQAGLDAGGSLDPGMAAATQQAARSASAARGFGTGGSDASVEALFAGQQANALQQQRQQFAQSVVGQDQSTSVDPFQAILGRSSNAVAGAGGAMQQAGSSAAGGPSLFNPWNSYSSDLYNTNYNANAAAGIANANNSTALQAAGISAVGQMGSSL